MPHLLVIAAVAMLAQSAPSSSETTNQPITLSGCVSRTAPQQPFTLLDAASGTRYRLTGKTVRKYDGLRVELVGAFPGSRLAVKGGLLPSPNTAAQAGAMDPTRAIVAGMSSAGSGADETALPEFQVARVRTLAGSCK